MIAGISHATEAMRRFVTKVQPGKSILIGGEPGVGKYHLARKIVNTYYKNDGIRSRYARIVKAEFGLPDPLTDEVVLVEDIAQFEELSTRIPQALWIPPLRERLEDIPPLLECFVTRSDDYDFWCLPENLSHLLAYWWPYNVAELRRVVTTRQVGEDLPHARTREILSHLPANQLISMKMESFWENIGKNARPGKFFQLFLDSVEREFIKTALSRCEWSVGETARLLDMHRNTLNQKMRKFRIVKKK